MVLTAFGNQFARHGKRLSRELDAGVAQGAEILDCGFDDVAGAQKSWGSSARADTRRRAGVDDIARKQFADA